MHQPANTLQPQGEVGIGAAAGGRIQGLRAEKSASTKSEWSKPPEGFEFVGTVPSSPRRRIDKHAPRSSKGTRAPRNSTFYPYPPAPRSPAPSHPSRKPPSPPDSRPTSLNHRKEWQDYEIPEELELVGEGTPKEIRDIIQQSLDDHRATKASRTNPHAIVVRTTIETDGTERRKGERVVAQCSASVSARSSPSPDRLRHRSASDPSARSSTKNPKSKGSSTTSSSGHLDSKSNSHNTSGDGLHSQRLPHGLESCETRPQNNAHPDVDPRMAALESKLQESKDRTLNSVKLFKLIPTTQTSTSPPHQSSSCSPQSKSSEDVRCFKTKQNEKTVSALACQHAFCDACPSRMVDSRFTSEKTSPIKGGSEESPSTAVQSYRPATALGTYDENALEHTLPGRGTHCCIQSGCARSLDTRPVENGREWLECPRCRTVQRTACRGQQHARKQDRLGRTIFNLNVNRVETARIQNNSHRQAMGDRDRDRSSRHVCCMCQAELYFSYSESGSRSLYIHHLDPARGDGQRGSSTAETHHGAQGQSSTVIAVENDEAWMSSRSTIESHQHQSKSTESPNVDLERRQRVVMHFKHLRKVLDSVRFHQRQAVEERHELSDRALLERKAIVKSALDTAGREIDLDASIQRGVVADNEAIMKALKQKHAATLMETARRHQRDQERLLSSLPLQYRPRAVSNTDSNSSATSSRSAASSHDAVTAFNDSQVKAWMLSSLLPAQEQERHELKARHAREIAKWQARGQQALRQAQLDSRNRILQTRLEEVEKIEGSTQQAKEQADADWRWFSAVFDDRMNMLSEDEARMLAQGGDIRDGVAHLHPSDRSHISASGIPSSEFDRPVHSRPPMYGRPKAATVPGPTAHHPLRSNPPSMTKRDISPPEAPESSYTRSSAHRRRPHSQEQQLGRKSVTPEPHPGRRIHFGPTDSWIEEEHARLHDFQDKRLGDLVHASRFISHPDLRRLAVSGGR